MKEMILFLSTLLSLWSEDVKIQANETPTKTLIKVVINPTTINIDSTFISFFEEFMWDKTFQQSRVLFPIQQFGIKINSAKEWIYLPFYTQSEHIPTLTSDTLSLFEKDLKERATNLYIVDFEKEESDHYTFEKVNLHWYLKNITRTPLTHLPDNDFIAFLRKFSADSMFQVNSISFPLNRSFADVGKDYETTTEIIQEKDWRFWKLTNDINRLLILDMLQKEHRYRNIFLRGIDNGIWIKYTFERKQDTWQLIKIEDYST